MTEEILSAVSSEVFRPVWFLIGAALVFWMQAGFAMVEAGFTRAKNTGNIIDEEFDGLLYWYCSVHPDWFQPSYLVKIWSGLIGKPGFDLFTSLQQTFSWSKFRIQPGILCNDSNHRFRCYGRENKIFILLYLFAQ